MRPAVLSSLALVLLCATLSLTAQSIAPTPASPLASCGDEKVNFDVSRGPVGTPSTNPAPDKATVYIIELFDPHDTHSFARPTIRHGLDGAWIGATQGFTYVITSVDPGPHHLCSRWQSHFGHLTDEISLNNFTAEAGHTYYFRVQITLQGGDPASGTFIDLQPVSEDEGIFLVSKAAQSNSKPKQ
jgi:hypothetical protein